MPSSSIPRLDRDQNRRACFRYSGYWHNWSLLLTERCNAHPGYGPTVEIDLTSSSADLDRLLRINVRRHCTEPGLRDRYTDELTTLVVAIIEMIFGKPLATWLLFPSTEILGKIDWARYAARCNGGASLYEIIHPCYLDQIPTITRLGAAA